jgi:hypothetical protein
MDASVTDAFDMDATDGEPSSGDPGLYFCWVEKMVIFFVLVSGLPLFYLDKEILGSRRYGWLAASTIGLYHLLLVDDGAETELAGLLDKGLLANLSVTVVPHLIKLVRDQSWMGLGIVPPFFMVTFQSMHTPVDPSRKDYWALRSFLHLFVFLLPYLNHLPSGPPPPPAEERSESGGGDGDGQGAAEEKPGGHEGKETTETSKKKASKPKTNKKKR